MDERSINVKIIQHYGPTCDEGRHMPPHGGYTCAEIDEYIAVRNQILSNLMREMWAQISEPDIPAADLAGTPFAATLNSPTPAPPLQTDIQRALAILAPHLAWDHRYRP